MGYMFWVEIFASKYYGRNKNPLISIDRAEFEKPLDSTLKESFLTRHVHCSLVKKVSENIRQKYLVSFVYSARLVPSANRPYFIDFFKRYE